MSLPSSPPGWAMAVMSGLVIVIQVKRLYDPTGYMAQYQINSVIGARLIAFLLILINGYDLVGALQDNWAVYWFSAAARLLATVFFYNLGPLWQKLAGLEFMTLLILLTSMYFA